MREPSPMKPLLSVPLAVVLCAGLGGWARCGDVSDGGLGAATASDGGPMNLVWADEFDGPAGQLPNPSNWTFDVGGTGWGNAQLEYDTNLAQNASLDGQGNLAITALATPYMGNAYSSARLQTQGMGEFTHGRFEARMQMPSGAGLWPAFWMLGSNFSTVGWPQCGEIDIMEYRGQEPDLVHGSLHGPGYSGGNAITQAYSDPLGFNGGFHVFDLDWTPDTITWSVDGVAYQTVTSAEVPAGNWVFEHSFFILLNLAVGGNYVGTPTSATVFPQTFLIDYVRVYGTSP
jgi:beta-glucanase (GH16 family)